MRFEDIKVIAAVGSGTMGHATAMEFAVKGYPVHLIDQTEALLAHGMDSVKHDVQALADHDLIGEQSVDDVLSRFTLFTDYEAGVRDAQYVTESVAEKLEIKQSIFSMIEKSIASDAILATNSSGLSPTAIASVLKYPERFVVAHYWNPAHLMPLVEVVPGEKTSQETVDVTMQLMTAIGKKPAEIKKESMGFVGNRIQMAVVREALHIVEAGIASAQDVDTIVKYSLGRRWDILGPIVSADLGGLDIFNGVSSYLLADLDNSTTPNKMLAQKVAKGNLGNKTGEGFYTWSGDEGAKLVAQRDEQLMHALKRDQERSMQ